MVAAFGRPLEGGGGRAPPLPQTFVVPMTMVYLCICSQYPLLSPHLHVKSLFSSRHPDHRRVVWWSRTYRFLRNLGARTLPHNPGK